MTAELSTQRKEKQCYSREFKVKKQDRNSYWELGNIVEYCDCKILRIIQFVTAHLLQLYTQKYEKKHVLKLTFCNQLVECPCVATGESETNSIYECQ